jgi:hypothetical protein
MENRVFFPQTALDQWIVDGAVLLDDGVLSMVDEGRRYGLVEAVRVVREVSGGGDGHDLVGRVKSRAYLEQLGAELVESSMLLGDAAYDVEPGWVGLPVGTFSEHVRIGSAAAVGQVDAESEEALLARFLSKHL